MKPGDHRKITDYTISNFSNEFSGTFKDLITEEKDHILNGSEYEDMFFHGMGLKRLFNWHFYSSEESEYLNYFKLFGLVKISPSSRDIMKFHSANFKDHVAKKTEKKKLLVLLGRILHHIQDMSTPSHVIPVYHSVSFMPKTFEPTPDMFEEFSHKNIDSFLLKLGDVKIHSYCNDYNCFTEIYHEAAESTLEYLESDESFLTAEVDGDKKQVSTELFWKKYVSTGSENKSVAAGFGEYGPFAHQFGEETIKGEYCCRQYVIKFNDYIEIYEYCLKKMVLDSIKCLKFAESIIH